MVADWLLVVYTLGHSAVRPLRAADLAALGNMRPADVATLGHMRVLLLPLRAADTEALGTIRVAAAPDACCGC